MMIPTAHTKDEAIAAVFSERLAEARNHLLREMEAVGLRVADGWRISETLRQVEDGCELVLRPVHRTQVAPPDLECIVHIDVQDETVGSTC